MIDKWHEGLYNFSSSTKYWPMYFKIIGKVNAISFTSQKIRCLNKYGRTIQVKKLQEKQNRYKCKLNLILYSSLQKIIQKTREKPHRWCNARKRFIWVVWFDASIQHVVDTCIAASSMRNYKVLMVDKWRGPLF